MRERSVRFAAVAMLAAAALLSCGNQSSSGEPRSSTSSESQGSVGLALVPVSGITLDSVHYVVTNGATPAVTLSEGELPTPGTAKEFSFGLSLPAGTGYTISLSASSAERGDNITCGASYGPFNVAANTSTNFSLALVCHDDTNGQLITGVAVKTDACPRIVFDYITAIPGAAPIDKDIAVSANARDLDGKALSYTWKLSSPQFATLTPLTGANSSLFCQNGGVGVVTVTANNGECSKSLSTAASCYTTFCGDGRVDPGETCDKAIPGVPCTADCTYVCGDGVAEAPAEDCDPGNTANCTEVCKTRAPKCNDGFLTKGEICDPSALPTGAPTGMFCRPDCSGFSEPVGPNQGSVEVSMPAPIVAMNSIHYMVTNAATPLMTLKEGDLPTRGAVSPLAFSLSLPAGTGYRIALSTSTAEPGDNITCGVAYSPFDLSANSSINIALVLQCHDDTSGQLITLRSDTCQKLVIDSIAALPGATKVGSGIALTGKAHDVDGKAITYSWALASPTTGTFSSVIGNNASLTCNAIKSAETLTMTASNGVCSKTLSTTVSCLPGG